MVQRDTPPKPDRPITIGLLINDLNDPNGNSLWHGVSSTLLENNCNLICYAGGSPDSPDEDDNQRTILYHLVDGKLLDGLLVWSGSINANLDAGKVLAFFEQFSPLPIISIATHIEGQISVVFDHYQGMCDAVSHLVQVHGRRRIVFIQGVDQQQQSNIRYHAYLDTLAYNHIPFDPLLVLPGDFEAEFGQSVVQHLVENHIEFDAIVTNDDSMAIAAMQTLQQLHFDLPGQVSVVGFDDQLAAQSAEIPLTTVHIPNFEMGRQAARLLLRMIRGEVLEQLEMIPLHLRVRQSCGCISPSIQQARLSPFIPLQESFPQSLFKRRQDVLAELSLAAGGMPGSESMIQPLFDAFMHDLLADQEGPSGAFLNELARLLKNWLEMERDEFTLEGVITTMRRQMLPAMSTSPHAQVEAENLWQQARVLISEFAHRVEVRRQILNQSHLLTLNTVNQALITAQYFNQLADAVFNNFPLLGFESTYISIYEDPSKPLDWARLKIAFDKGRKLPLGKDGIRFHSPKLIPNNTLKREGGQSWAVMPLHFKQEKIGFALLKAGPGDGMIYEAIRFQLSSALKSVALHKELIDLSLIDSLTGIGNRRSFDMFLNKEVERNLRYHNGLCLIMVDLDEFKIYNNTFGFPAGDQALIEVAQIISSCARRRLDIVVRLGGDEFALVLTETSQEGARTVGESIRQKIENYPHFQNKLTVSVGVASMSTDENETRSLVDRCDQALNHSKRAGRNQVTVLEPQQMDKPENSLPEVPFQ